MEDRLRPLSKGLLERVRFVLCRTRNPQNLGAAARALRSTGIADFVLVDPHTVDFEAARPTAVHAEELLAQARVVPSLEQALRGCSLSIATTVRARHQRPPLRPREAATRLAASEGPVALVFGDERNGLDNAEVGRCDLVSCIPSDPGQPSWNLAQTIAVYAYEVRMAALAEAPWAESQREPPEGKSANPGQLANVDRALAELLDGMGWSQPRRRLAKGLQRAQLTEREARLWTALLLELHKRLGRPTQ